jgi:hypothetical protein
MILADTTVWIDHLRSLDPDMDMLLRSGAIAMHPFVAAEVALGSLRDRRKTLSELDSLVAVQVARTSEVRFLIESHTLFSKGIGLTDAHLLASCLTTPGAILWTRDVRLRRIAEILGIHANLP